MIRLEKIREFVVGSPRDPLDPETRSHIALVAFLGWVGLGADGLSSACYGPEEAFIALGAHTYLSVYLAVATAFTVFIISLAYNQVIELFPSGGGGYKVATKLIGPHAGLVSGAALILDYVLTITISIASGVDAIASLLPISAQPFKLTAEFSLIFVLIWLNLRGMKESIKILIPIFLGFVGTHAFLIIYGVMSHVDRLPSMIQNTVDQTFHLGGEMGWIFVASTLLFAYSQGGGTYTGLEAVSNNVNTLAEPRVKTGKWTMFYMAISLAFTAGGIILLYLLWDVAPVKGQTLNAVTFDTIMHNWQLGGVDLSGAALTLTLFFEGGLLFIAANTGFLGGPSVLANMAADQWMPHRFSYLSSTLAKKNGIAFMGISALIILWLTHGKVAYLVVLYSINVFLTFSLSLLGMCIYWWRHSDRKRNWVKGFFLSFLGLCVTSFILAVLIVEKFAEGGWITILITGVVIGICLLIKEHYKETKEQLRTADRLFAALQMDVTESRPDIVPNKPTAVFLVGKHKGVGMHTLLSVQRLFPNQFKNFVFVRVGEVDSQSYDGEAQLKAMQKDVDSLLNYFVNFCHQNGMPAVSYHGYGTDITKELTDLAEKAIREFPHAVFFASNLIFKHDNWLTNLLHNQTAFAMQRRLHLKGAQMVILPMKI